MNRNNSSTGLTVKSAREQLRPLGIVLSTVYGPEYRVRVIGSPAGEGYFTTSIDDAYDSGLRMSLDARKQSENFAAPTR